MNKLIKKMLVTGASLLILAGFGVGVSSQASASDYMRSYENRATYTRRVYVRKPISVERMTGSVFATMHCLYWKHLRRNQRIGVVPFYHMGHDGYVVHIPGKRGIYYAPTNSRRWFGRRVKVHHHRYY